MSTTPTLYRKNSLKVEGSPIALDTGPDRHLRVRNDGADVLYLAADAKLDSRADLVVPGETVTLTERRFAWSPGRARLHIAEYWGKAA